MDVKVGSGDVCIANVRLNSKITAETMSGDIEMNDTISKEQVKKEAKKNQHVIETKEIQLTPQIGGHDMETKARAASKFLAAGNKVKVGVRYRGRQMTHIEVGEEVMNKFIESLKDIAVVEKPATMDGRWLVAILAPVKKK